MRAMKTITKVLLIILVVFLILFVIAFILLVIFLVMLSNWRRPDRDSDTRSPEIRMSEYYGETFTLTGTKKTESFTIWTMQDSAGNECHAACGRDYDAGFGIYRIYDDYRVVQQMQTPAVQRLLNQERFHVRYDSEIGINAAFLEDLPDCCWVIEFNDDNDLAAAVQLALDTVMAEDSLLPPPEIYRSKYWRSIVPTVMLCPADYKSRFDPFYEPYEFSDSANAGQHKYDYETELNAVQERYSNYVRYKNKDVQQPEEAVLAHPESGICQIQCVDAAPEPALTWDSRDT